jgi:tetratricopeptide (TPR) repeat protein
MLGDLRNREMVLLREETSFEGSGEYVFRHAILRDVTYETLVPRQRRTHHKLVGDWLIGIGGERANEHTLLVAEHYERAGEPALAAGQLSQAGQAAMILSAMTEAITAFERAMELLKGEEHLTQRLDLRVRLGEAFAMKGDFGGARTHLEPALEEARKAGETRAQAKALAQLARITGIWEGDLKTAHTLLREALPLARDLNDPDVLIFILRQMGSTVQSMGIEDPEPYLAESIELARQQNSPGAVAAALNTLAISKEIRGDHEAAMEIYEESLALFREVGNRFGISMVLMNLTEARLIENNVEIAQPLFDEGYLIAKEVGSEGMLMGYTSLQAKILAQQEKLEDARVHLLDALRRSRALANRVGYLDGTFVEAYIRSKEGDRSGALALLALVMSDEATDPVLRKTASELAARLIDEMPEEESNAAIARGKRLDLEEVVSGILQEVKA